MLIINIKDNILSKFEDNRCGYFFNFHLISRQLNKMLEITLNGKFSIVSLSLVPRLSNDILVCMISVLLWAKKKMYDDV